MPAVELDDRRLNDTVPARHGNWTDTFPCAAVVGAALDPAGPGVKAFYRGAADDGPIFQQQRLGADRAVKTGREMLRGGPCLPIVIARTAARSPFARRRTEFVVKPEPAVFRIE